VSVAALLPPLDLGRLPFALAAIIGLASLSVILIKISEQYVDIEVADDSAQTYSVHVLKVLAIRTAAVLLVPAVVLAFLSPDFYGLIPGTLWAGSLKAAHWALLFSIVSCARLRKPYTSFILTISPV
jgi:hypothetical protein